MPPAKLSLHQEELDGVRLIRVEGPLDSMTYDQLKDYLDSIMSTPHVRVVLDCSKLSYVNSRGITLLARYQKMASFVLSFLGVAGLKPRIMRAIDLLGMTKLIHLYPTVDDAMRAAIALGLGSPEQDRRDHERELGPDHEKPES